LSEELLNTWGYSLFADDLRQEVGGKASLMGMYQRDIIVTADTLPVMLPKLVVWIEYFEYVNKIDSDLKFVVEFSSSDPNTKIPPLDQTIKRSGIAKIDPAKRSDEGDLPINHFRIPFVMTPFPVVAEGTIKVRCYFDSGVVLKLGRLNIKIKPTSQELVTKS